MSLDGPLSVLYKFLEYFSAFDWDKYGISLIGPVRLSEVPRIVAERPPNCNELLLEVGFLRHCAERFSVPMRPGDFFSKKYLNIVDPLNDRNNLGRSVSQGNFFRIRSAFSYGARKLEQILVGPEDNLAEELKSFFSNTLNMHGNGQRPDLPDNLPGEEKSFTTTGKPRSSNDENSYDNRISNEGKDVSALALSSESEGGGGGIPFYAPHLLFHYSKLVDKENGDEKESENLNPSEPLDLTGENSDPSEPLDLTGDLMSHLVCLDHVRWWNSYVLALPPMMGPPPPPPPILLSMIASEHGGVNGGVRRQPRFHPADPMFMSRPPFVPNDPNSRGAMAYLSDMNQSRPGPITHPTPQREPLLHRRRHQNPNRPRNPDNTQRPRSVSGTDRFDVQSSYHLKDEDDFPPLSA